jgi:hypothetical protein
MNKKKWICYGFQILFGLTIILSGINKFFDFIPIPYEGLAGEVMVGLVKASRDCSGCIYIYSKCIFYFST